MNDIIQQVFDLSEVILATQPTHVWLNQEGINKLIDQMKKDGTQNFYDSEPEKRYQTGIYLEVLKEIVASSINYCYWYGAHDIRPNGVSSTSMYNDVNSVFDSAHEQALNFERRIESLISLLAKHRYPLLEERKRHLLELCESRKAEIFANSVHRNPFGIGIEKRDYELFETMVGMFHGFASDMFLKRASLFFIQLYRKFGWFKDTLMKTLFVPADYQVPKVLRYFDCIIYSDKGLSKKVFDNKLIEKHSLEELQIRAATIKVCKKLQIATGWTIADVDTYLWTKRKLTNSPFHATITTDY